MRLSHLTAVATLVALLGAMLVSVGSVSAVSRDKYVCIETSDTDATLITAEVQSDGSAAPANAVHLVTTSGAVAPSLATVNAEPPETSACPSGVAKDEAVYVVRKGADSYGWSATQDGPAQLSISFSDTDGIIPNDGTGISVTVDIVGGGQTDIQSEITTSTLAWIRVSGELDGHERFTGDGGVRTIDSEGDMLAVAAATKMGRTFPIIVPKGTTPGEYTVSASLSIVDSTSTDGPDDGDAPDARTLTASKPFTVGDAGTNVSDATLSLASGQEASVAANTDPVMFELSILNSLGKPSNVGTGTAAVPVVIVAPGGTIDYGDGFMASGTNQTAVKNTVKFTVAKATAGTVDVKALVVSGSVAESETITLTFTGSVATVSLSEPATTLLNQAVGTRDDPDTDANEDDDPRDSLTLTLTAADSAGNVVSPTKVANSAIVIKDPDGVHVGTGKIARMAADPAKKAIQITLTSDGSASAPLDSGEYTIEVTSGGKKATSTFIVAAGAADIALEVESNKDPLELGAVITVTATVTDAGGLSVGNGTTVDFSTGGALELDDVGNVMGIKTKDGMATARFIVSKGDGLATIIAESGSATGTTTVSLPAPEAEAMPVEEASVGCLSNLSGFSTWSCGVESSASEIFGLVSARGVTAIHLHNGTAWVRYSVVDGAMVPGSSDFMVTENDILYISN